MLQEIYSQKGDNCSIYFYEDFAQINCGAAYKEEHIPTTGDAKDFSQVLYRMGYQLIPCPKPSEMQLRGVYAPLSGEGKNKVWGAPPYIFSFIRTNHIHPTSEEIEKRIKEEQSKSKI